MKKIILILLLICSTLLSQNNEPEQLPKSSIIADNLKVLELTEDEKKYLIDKTFNVYMEKWAPFQIIEQDEKQKNIFKGLAVDYFNYISMQTGAKFNFIYSAPFSKTLEAVKKDPFGIIPSTSITKDKEGYAIFSTPLVSYPIGIATDIDNPFLIDLNDLEGKTVAVGKSYTAHVLLEKYYPKIKFVPTKNTQVALDLVANEKVYAAADILPPLISKMNFINYSDLKISGRSDFKIDLRVMANHHSSQLIVIINKVLNSMTIQQKDAIENKWISSNKVIKVLDYTYALWILGLSAILFIIFILKQRVIKKEKEKFKLLLKNATDGIHILDMDGDIFDCSDSFATTLGYKLYEIKKLNIKDWDARIPQKRLLDTINKLFDQPSTFETVHKRKDGSTLPAQISVKGIEIDDKKYLYCSQRDISMQKQLEDQIKSEKTKYQTLMNRSSDAIFILDIKDGSIIQYNQMVIKLLGFTDQELEKVNIFTFDKELTTIDDYQRLINQITYTPSIVKRVNIKKDGTMFDASINLVRIEIDNKEYLYASVRDVSQEKKLQDELANSLKKIEESENTYRGFMDSVGQMVAVMDQDGNYIDYFKGVNETIHGYSKEEVIGQNFSKFTPQNYNDIEEMLTKIHEAYNGKENIRYEKIVKHKNGKISPYEVTLSKGNYFGNPVILAVIVDIADQKRIEKELQDRIKQQDALLNIETTGLVQTKHRKFIWTNHAFERMLGYEKDELLGQQTRIIYQDEESYKEFGKGYPILKEKGVYTTELRCIKKDGTPIILLGSMTAIDLDTLEAIGVFTDITPLKQTLVELENAKHEADRANEAKSEFLANMSHEIRTPLNGTIGLTDIVLDTKLTQMQREYLQKAQNSSQSLLHIINDILDYSKIEAGKLDIVHDEFKLNELLQSLTHLFGFQIYEKGLELNYTVDPKIHNNLIGDGFRINQILTNFVGNAIKFTHQGYIQINIALKKENLEENKALLEFSVKDTGIGIAKQNQTKLFNSFTQEDGSTTKKFGGTGLGLAISKQLIEMMGGEIFFSSQKDIGSTFGFTLELEYKQQSSNNDTHYFKDKKFLVIDDNKIDREYLCAILTSWGINSSSVENGLQAYEILKKQDIDYLFVDWQMPELDGLELLEKLQNENIQIPHILMITAHNKEKLLNKAKSNSIYVEKILEKPYTPSIIYNLLFDSNEIQIPSQNRNKQVILDTKETALLVEDNETNQIVATSILEKIGFDVECANDGVQAVAKAKYKKYSIIFMDLQMPNMDGFEASLKIRKFDTTTPIIALSAAVMAKDKELTKKAKMNDHLAKPINTHELFKVIKQHFSTTTQRSQLQDVVDVDMVEIDGIDIQKVLQITNMELQSLYQMYIDFANSFKNIKEIIESFTNDKVALKKYIHKLKGSSGNLKINEVFELAKQIHDDENYKLLNELVESTTKFCQKIFNVIEPHIDNTQNNTLDDDSLKKMIKEIIIDVDNYELIESSRKNQLLESLKVKIDNNTSSKLFDSFEDGDNELTSELLNEILEKL